MSGKSKTASRGFAAAVSGVIAAGVAVLINMWTSGWAWPSGAGLGILVGVQAAFEWYRVIAEGRAAATRRLVVEQRCSAVQDSELAGTGCLPGTGDIEVRQRFGYVNRSVIVGINGDGGK